MDDRKRELGAQSTLAMTASDQVGSDSELGPGAAIGHFVVRHKLGAGGMGVVFACDDADLGRQVAVKLVRAEADDPAYRARLLREAQAMARLEHPNVIRVHEVGSDRGRLFIAMEYVDGETLTAWLAKFRTWQDVVDMFQQIGAGLAAVHASGLVHRDFKPDNVLVDRRAKPRVMDFGLARLDAEGDASPLGQPLTRSGVMMGTPGYMAPEQQFGAAVDARADQYSFCVALREALGGRPVDEARWAKVPAHVRAAIARGLAYDPDERYASMTELLAALRAPAPPASEPKWIVALLVLAVLGIVAGIVVYFNNRDPERKPVSAAAPPAPAPVPGADESRAPTNADELRAPTNVDESHVPTNADASRVATSAVDADVVVPTQRDNASVRASKLRPPPTTSSSTLASSSTPTGHVAITAGSGSGPIAISAGSASGPVATTAGSGSGAPAITVIRPTTKGLDAAKVGHPAHQAAVRAAIKDLGYDGFDASWTKAELQQEVDTLSGPERGIAQVKLGMALRRAGDCTGAVAQWLEAIKALHWNEPKEQAAWHARAWEGRALCALAAGNGADAFEYTTRVWVNGNQDEVRLLMGFAKYELGEKDTAHGLLLVADQLKNPKVRAALDAWLQGQGLTLR